MRFPIYLALSLLPLMSACAGLAPGQATVQVHQAAPEIALTDQHHQPVSLHKLTAKGSVLVVFYRGHF